MKNKYFIILTLMFCMGVFLFPATVYAADSPLTITAKVAGEVLEIEASGGSIGVEAIFINEQRFNFRVDGVLKVDLLAYKDSEEIAVYAMDFSGNVSNVVNIANPHYIGLTSQQAETQAGIPITSAKPFTPDGQASVLDNVTNLEDKEFFTFTTSAGNVFFLVVDRQRGSDNVYFLNAVTERDLIALAEQSEEDIVGGIPVSTTSQNPAEPLETPQEEPTNSPPPDKDNGNGTMIFMLIAVAIAGGVGYYLKIVRPKQQSGNGDYEDEDEDEDEDIMEEMEFEDDPGDTNEADGNRDDDYYNMDDDENEPKVEDDGL